MTSATQFEKEALPQMDALHAYALQLCRDEQLSQDLVQETMLKAYRYFHTYKEGTNCRAWLFQICKNSYINHYRRRQYEPMVVDFQESTLSGTFAAEGMSTGEFHPSLRDEHAEQGHHHVLGDEAFSALREIPVDYQTAIMLSDIEGYTYQEIAEFSRVPIGTIRSRIHRARKMLADRLVGYAQHNGYCRSTSPTNN